MLDSGAAGAVIAYRYYLSSTGANGASYAYGGKVEWPPEASSQMVGQLSDRREPGRGSDRSGGRAQWLLTASDGTSNRSADFLER